MWIWMLPMEHLLEMRELIYKTKLKNFEFLIRCIEIVIFGHSDVRGVFCNDVSVEAAKLISSLRSLI